MCKLELAAPTLTQNKAFSRDRTSERGSASERAAYANIMYSTDVMNHHWCVAVNSSSSLSVCVCVWKVVLRSWSLLKFCSKHIDSEEELSEKWEENKPKQTKRNLHAGSATAAEDALLNIKSYAGWPSLYPQTYCTTLLSCSSSAGTRVQLFFIILTIFMIKSINNSVCNMWKKCEKHSAQSQLETGNVCLKNNWNN